MEDQFIIVVSFQGNKEEIEVTNPHETIGTIIENLIQALDLPKLDGGGNPVTYYLGKVDENNEEVILHASKNKKEQTLLDYDVESGEELTITMVPIAG